MLFRAAINSHTTEEVDVTDICPNCKKPTNPYLVNSSYFPITNKTTSLSLTFRCLGCKHFWVEEFEATESMDRFGSIFYEIDHIEVTKEQPSDISISDDIELISPIGKAVYLQALYAENESLDLIAGIGYRKALEFFVKDFVIALNHDDEEKVSKMLLKNVIDSYIDDETLKTFATASAFIGNDETHYTRRHSDKDIRNLKKYLHGFLHYMDLKLSFLDAQELVNRQKNN